MKGGYDILGYNMQYYKAATTKVIMKYNKAKRDSLYIDNKEVKRW